MAKPSETRKQAQLKLNMLLAQHDEIRASPENFNTIAIVTALLYIGDQLGYLNSTMEYIQNTLRSK